VTAAELRSAQVRALDEAAPPASKLALDALARMWRRAEGVEAPAATPWPRLNAALGGGLWPGLHVLVGNTGSGKTQFALEIALHAARDGMPVLYVSLEGQVHQFTARQFSLLLSMLQPDVPAPTWSDLSRGKDRAGLERAENVAGPALVTMPWFRVESGIGNAWNAAHLADRAEAMAYAHADTHGEPRRPLVILDYLQLVGPTPDAQRDDLRERIRSAAIEAQNVARSGATVLVLSSVARSAEGLLAPSSRRQEQGTDPVGEGDPTRLVGLGKEAGEIEFSADTVLALAREEFTPGATPVHLAIAKQREGPPAWVHFTFNGQRFVERLPRTGPSPVSSLATSGLR